MITIHLGKLVVLVGLIILMVGLLVWSGLLNWFGRLPGDVRIARRGFRFDLPWVSLLMVSVGFNLLVLLARRFLL